MMPKRAIRPPDVGQGKESLLMDRHATGNGIIARQRQAPILVERARQLRRRATDAERQAWELLRGRRFRGLRFRRQQVLGPFIVDFYCAALRLAIELDGPIHDEEGHPVRDAERDRYLEELGVRLVRIRNEDLSVERLGRILGGLNTPSPGGRGGGGVRGFEEGAKYKG